MTKVEEALKLLGDLLKVIDLNCSQTGLDPVNRRSFILEKCFESLPIVVCVAGPKDDLPVLVVAIAGINPWKYP